MDGTKHIIIPHILCPTQLDQLLDRWIGTALWIHYSQNLLDYMGGGEHLDHLSLPLYTYINSALGTPTWVHTLLGPSSL